jgi:hypothetical protein
MQMADIGTNCDARQVTLSLLEKPQETMASFFRALEFDVEEETRILSLLNFSYHHEADGLDMMMPQELVRGCSLSLFGISSLCIA